MNTRQKLNGTLLLLLVKTRNLIRIKYKVLHLHNNTFYQNSKRGVWSLILEFARAETTLATQAVLDDVRCDTVRLG